MKSWKASPILWYIIFGALHEASHVLAALLFFHSRNNHVGPLLDMVNCPKFWYDLLLARQVAIEGMSDGLDEAVPTIHHVGWIVSLMVALIVSTIGHANSRTILQHAGCSTFSSMQIAAWVTAAEALATDLLGMGRLLPAVTSAPSSTSATIFWCGNFGILLLHHLWFQDRAGREAALDCLEQMVQITMMRGAQSGGVVTYQPNGKNKNGLKGIRCRVVNKKRTDLSKELRKQLSIPHNLPKHFFPFLSGHTRFATSSLSTLGGTHPHQWTPPTQLNIYDFDTSFFRLQTVENFITHNGDLDFYQLNGNTYEIETILEWLAQLLGVPAPASVDSMAIAGLIDVLRCQGCFALAARYAIGLGMSTATMDTTSPLPSKMLWDKIGVVFEECWITAQKESSSLDVGSITFRAQVAMAAAHALREHKDLLQPLREYGALVDDEDGPGSLQAFCMSTVHAFLDNDLFYSVQMFLKHAKGSFGLTVSSSWDAHRRVVIAARGQPVSGGDMTCMISFRMGIQVSDQSCVLLSCYRCRLGSTQKRA